MNALNHLKDFIVRFLFTVDGWGMALSTPGDMIPVRFEMKGSHNYNISGSDVTYFHVIGDFIDFIPTPPTDLTPLQVSWNLFALESWYVLYKFTKINDTFIAF